MRSGPRTHDLLGSVDQFLDIWQGIFVKLLLADDVHAGHRIRKIRSHRTKFAAERLEPSQGTLHRQIQKLVKHLGILPGILKHHLHRAHRDRRGHRPRNTGRHAHIRKTFLQTLGAFQDRRKHRVLIRICHLKLIKIRVISQHMLFHIVDSMLRRTKPRSQCTADGFKPQPYIKTVQPEFLFSPADHLALHLKIFGKLRRGKSKDIRHRRIRRLQSVRNIIYLFSRIIRLHSLRRRHLILLCAH